MATTRHAVVLCLAMAAGPATADDHAPSSLRMRPTGVRVAQLPPAPPSGAPPVTASPADPASSDILAAPAVSAPSTLPATPAPTLPEDGKTEVISVTDPAIEHRLRTGRAPVTVVTRAELAASGRATLGDILQSLPIQANAANAQVNAGGDGTTRINLRGLGAPRTLVLLNGRRMVNSGPGADSAVDLNAIPLAMIERVEILKDGASAIYGADAIGGVVNLITRPKFDGTDVSLLTSTSQRGDGTEYDASFVTGFTTADKRTYLVVSGGYQHHDSVFAGDREFSAFQNSYDFASRTQTRHASLAAPSGRLDVSSIGAGGVRPAGCASDVCKPVGDGAWTAFVAPRDLYNDAEASYLYTPSSRYNVFATAGNRINDSAALLIELLYQHHNTDRQLSPVAFVADAPISKDSLYNPLGGDVLDYRRRVTELGPRQYTDDGTVLRLVVGVTGNVPASLGVLEDWKYEVSYNYGSTQALAATTGQLLKPRLADALGPSMLDAHGVPICVRTPGDASTQIVYLIPADTGSNVVPCVPLNLFAPTGKIPRDQLKNVTYTDAGTGSDRLGTLLATAGGRIAELPDHGDISLSFGTDYRDETGEQLPPDVAAVGYTTDNAARPTSGQFHLFEGFGELAIVPISGHGIAQWVELDLGARAVRHDRFGSSLTYKVGGLFRTVHGIAARGTYATAFRAPSVPDTFGGQVERTPAAEDPCDTRPPSLGDGTRMLDPKVQAACTAQGVPVGSKFATSQQLSVVGGNPDLRAETAATTTLGVVVEPPELNGLALTIDYWHINIDHAIETLGVQTIFASCYDRGIQAYCDQIHRDPITHRISPVDQILQNVSRTTTSGIDVGLWYETQLAELGRIHTGLEGQYLLRYDLHTALQVIHGAGFYDLGVYPRYKANLSSNWVHPSGASAGFTLRFIGTYKECADDNCNDAHDLAAASRDVDRYFKLDLFGGYGFGSAAGRTTLQLGVNNVLDATPPVIYNAAAANSDAQTYDFVGRMVYVRLAQLF
jgi:outer membrane receptor protein involved in Fe transport